MVATPIGNLSDISNRALDILRGADVILAEDTRVTKKLSSRFNVDTPIVSFHSHSGEEKKLKILKRLIEGDSVALVTDAGTPGISDPGNELIDYLLQKEPLINVVPIPGASAITAALSICGFDVNKFVFLGFFPKKKRSKLLLELSQAKRAYVFYESPNRLLRTLESLREHVGETRRVFIGRELTKMYEETFRGELNEVINQIKAKDPRGEVVVVVEKLR